MDIRLRFKENREEKLLEDVKEIKIDYKKNLITIFMGEDISNYFQCRYSDVEYYDEEEDVII